MASFTPYTYIQCPCHDSAPQGRSTDDALSATSHQLSENDDGHAFDPRTPRSNFSLYPLEHLLYCDVCHQIRCPRCVAEELVTIYCPNCLFEVGSSSLKTEGNRCTRSCFQCPICIGPLAVQALETPPETTLLSADNAAPSPTYQNPWVLTCSYCYWNSSEIGVKFDKPQGIFGQLQKLRYGEEQSKHVVSGDTSPIKLDAVPETDKARFAALKSFYGSQTVSANPSAGLAGLGDYGLNSPGALTRIMSIYSGSNISGLKQKNKPAVMREADSAKEGFRPSDLDESAAISRLRRDGWDGTATGDQVRAQVEEGAQFASQLWPIPYLLRTKRSKRCPACRHIISKPESKVTNTRWRMRLVANNYIPSIFIRPLHHHHHHQAAATTTTTTTAAAGSGRPLTPAQPAQFILTFRNPLFDSVKVTLAAPATTPGRFASRVTVLCPEFQIDANPDNDMYLDDVLRDGDADRDRQRQRGESIHQAEAGKVWERGRNWVSIVVEVVPASLRPGPPPALFRREGDPEPDLGPLREDEDVLEIPMFVRLEWESEATQDQVGAAASREKDVREKRELAYWCALGIGRISQE
ncbi:putative dynactin p62 family protein [Rosellinia necatrix]|uniref:Dynactin subunit 4 n=1 Tax=Rosellinia necatrix TaxID=77044 RepID=A0A1W2TJS1_ROSNE|nr:putative dynactin p62 family protein [Rosellinia necatrix]